MPVSVAARRPSSTKLLENTFRHVNIALVNELAMFAHDLGIDVWEAIDAASTKPFGYMRFTPGPGVGGHCLPIDPSLPVLAGAAQRSARAFRFVELANDVNDHMPDYVVRRLVARAQRAGAGRSTGRRILLLGPGLQDEHRRRPRVAGRSGRRAAARRSAPRCGPPTRTWSSRSRSTGGWPGSS